jgi:uncharacterized membrane-anchored protein
MRNEVLNEAIARCRAGDWKGAHGLVNDDEADALAMWLHAWLHRIEGDQGNARYWYRKARRSPFDGSVDEECAALTAAVAARVEPPAPVG